MNKELPKIIISGSSGFIGKHLKKNLSNDYEIISLNKEKLHRLIKDKNYKKDFLNQNKSKNIHALIHLGAYVHKRSIFVSEKLKKYIYFSNVEVSKNLAELSLDLNIKKFIFTSTVGVYGKGTFQSKNFDTFSPLMPENLYSSSKLAAEYALQYIFSECPERLIILRVASILSEFSPGSLKILKFFAKNSIPFPIFLISNQVFPRRSFTHLADLKNIFKSLISNNKNNGRIINIASKKYSIIELLTFFNSKNKLVRYFYIKFNCSFAKLLLRIPILKDFVAPLILNHQIFSNLINEKKEI